MATIAYAVSVTAMVALVSISYTYSMPTHATARLSIADWSEYYIREPEGPGTYAFGYDIEDPPSFRNEERHANGTVTGAYGYLQDDGTLHVVNYIADHLGYRAQISQMRFRDRSQPLGYRATFQPINDNSILYK